MLYEKTTNIISIDELPIKFYALVMLGLRDVIQRRLSNWQEGCFVILC